MPKKVKVSLASSASRIQQLEGDLAHERAKSDSMRAVAIALANAEERERRVLAKDLHDDLGQLLAVISLKMVMLQKQSVSQSVQDLLQDCASVVQIAHQKTRAITAQLNPPMLDQLGLIPALQWLADEMQRLHRMDVVIHDDGQPKMMQAAVSATLFRAVREWLQSMVCAGHSEAEISVEVGQNHMLVLMVYGWSQRFDPATFDVSLHNPATGLVSMREKIGYLGGHMTLIPYPDGGAVVMFEVPLQSIATNKELS